MILKSIEMNNFRVFYGTQRIELNDDLNIIVGANGTGKTSVIEAINWCLYEISRSSILNFKVAEEGGEKAVSVKCEFEDEDEDDVILIKREVLFDEENNLNSEEFNVILNGVVIENPNYFIDNKFPRQLYDLSKTYLVEDISSLKHFMAKEYGVNDLQTVKVHLNKVLHRYLNDFKKLDNKPLDSLMLLEHELAKVSTEQEQVNMGLVEVEKAISMESEIYHAIPDVKPLMIEKEMLTDKIRSVSDEIKHQENNLTSLLVDNVPLSLVRSKMVSDESIDFKEIEGLLYKHFPKGALYIKKSQINEIKDSFSKIHFLNEEYDDIAFKIKEIDSKLNFYPDVHFDRLTELVKLRDQLQHKNDHLSVEKKDLIQKLKKVSRKTIDNNFISNINDNIDFIETVIFSIEKLISEINDVAQKGLTDSISKYFLNNSFPDYDEVVIDNDFNISFLKSGFKLNYSDLSNAERVLLGLSLIVSISNSNNNFPLILDTPFGPLDGENRKLLINMLENIGVQKILLLSTYEASNLPADYKLDVENGSGVILNGE